MCIDKLNPEKNTKLKLDGKYMFVSRFSVVFLVVNVRFRGQSNIKYYAQV